MDIQDLGSIGELIAEIATIGTLGYLGFQIHMHTRHSRAYTQQNILNELTIDHVNAAKVPLLTRQALSDFERLSSNDQLEFTGIMLPLTVRFEATLRLHRSGLVDDDLFRAHRAFVLSWLITPGGSQWWNMYRESYSPDVRELLNSAIDNNLGRLSIRVQQSLSELSFEVQH